MMRDSLITKLCEEDSAGVGSEPAMPASARRRRASRCHPCRARARGAAETAAESDRRRRRRWPYERRPR